MFSFKPAPDPSPNPTSAPGAGPPAGGCPPGDARLRGSPLRPPPKFGVSDALTLSSPRGARRLLSVHGQHEGDERRLPVSHPRRQGGLAPRTGCGCLRRVTAAGSRRPEPPIPQPAAGGAATGGEERRGGSPASARPPAAKSPPGAGSGAASGRSRPGAAPHRRLAARRRGSEHPGPVPEAGARPRGPRGKSSGLLPRRSGRDVGGMRCWAPTTLNLSPATAPPHPGVSLSR